MSSSTGHGAEHGDDRRSAEARGQAEARQAEGRAQTATQTAERREQVEARAQHRPAVALESEMGNTRIAESVVAKIAGLAARDISGVFSMGSGMARRMGQLRSIIPGSSEAASQGVSVEVGEREAAVDLNLVTWYGQSIVEICDAVRRNVVGQVEGMTGLRVVEVNIQVDDIQVETPEPQSDTPQRVQ